MTQMTTMTMAPRRTAPRPEPLPYGLLDAAPPQDGRAELADDLYVSVNCMGLPAVGDLCDDEVASPTYMTQQLIDGIRFVTDLGIKCQAMAYGDLDSEFVHALDLRESAAVEQSLMALRFTGTAGGAAATDITPSGGAVEPRVGLALLEGDAAKGYVGLPTIHSPRTVASLLDSQGTNLTKSGRNLYTALGSKFVAGAGYEDNVGPDTDPPDPGEMWMYATGEVGIVRSRRVMIDPILDQGSNIVTARAQRIYVVDIDCYLSAVRVNIS